MERSSTLMRSIRLLLRASRRQQIPQTGGVKRVVNFDILRQLLGDDAVEDATEAYEFNWVGKQAARAEVLRPINKTLRPVKEDSVDWDNT